jgi:hypothetical protein
MPEAIQDLQSRKESNNFEVWEENWEIVEMFMRMQTQWNVGMSGAVGLNYPSLEWLCKLYAVQDPLKIFEGIRIMEASALKCFTEQRGK